MFSIITLFVFVVIFIVVGVSLVYRTTLTGDEPRYLYYSESYAAQGNFHLSFQKWKEILSLQRPKTLYKTLTDGNGSGVVLQHGGVPAHAVLLPVVLSPLSKLISSVPYGRIATLFVAIASLTFLHYWLLSIGIGPGVAISAIMIGGMSLPFMSYSALFLPEIWLAFAFVMGLSLSLNPSTFLKIAARSVLIVVIPFIHIRGFSIAIPLSLILLYQIMRHSQASERITRFGFVFLIFIIGGILFIRFNVQLYGNILGSASTARPIIDIRTISALFSNFRHGLFVYSPVFLFGIIGLLIAATQCNIIGYAGLLSLISIMTISAGPDPGECPPVRFMVQAIPVLIIGLAFWIKSPRKSGVLLTVIFGASLLWTFSNSIYYFLNPSAYFKNRSNCITCDTLLGKVGLAEIINSGYHILDQNQ